MAAAAAPQSEEKCGASGGAADADAEEEEQERENLRNSLDRDVIPGLPYVATGHTAKVRINHP